MSWQEELRRLDDALATGQITADDYRRSRDRLLATAAGGVDGGQGQGGQAQGGQGQPPASGQPAPFPEPFRWTAQPPDTAGGQAGQSDSDRTQVVPNSGQGHDRTQVVPNSGQDRTQAVQPSGEQTQIVRPVGPPGPPPPGYSPQWQHGQMSQQQQVDAAPPWGDPDQPLPWMGFHAQGPEIFESDPKSGGGKVWAIVGGVVAVLLVAGLVLWLTVFNSGDQTADPQPSQNPTTTTAAPTPTTPEPFGTLVVPEGTTSGPKTYDAQSLAKSKPLPTPDLLLLKQAGVNEARSVIVVQDGATISLWAFAANDPGELLENIETDQKRFGFTEKADLAQGSVKVFGSQQSSGDKKIYAYRAHYVSGGEVIRVETFSTDDAAAKSAFTTVLQNQLAHTPAR
ncbi:hypothetical protein [Actinokineospora sp. UTMC 2448]|uniref:hypothetical protein n=1 Tax=Actinokineospora sp. UTMC 2448 TaxID=2268449 RepID=UPI0021649E05|nr:hypothetical protein [Actinokineospora sp. UTMC 2448]UVS76391.1 hypothetical protein Actkin_00075 [Actinokineospora sp. UTMC 2448]